MTERVFTDKDLENAKREIRAARRMEWPFPDAEALIHRLECAEAALMANCECKPKDHPDKCAELIAWNKWCDSKSAGRE